MQLWFHRVMGGMLRVLAVRIPEKIRKDMLVCTPEILCWSWTFSNAIPRIKHYKGQAVQNLLVKYVPCNTWLQTVSAPSHH
jgi:hypothetical protein